MQFINTIPPDKEKKWTAFLNGEPDISDFTNLDKTEMDDLTSAWETAGTNFSFSSADPDQAWLNVQNKITKSDKDQNITKLRSLVFKYAAMIVVMFGVGFATYKIVQTPKKQSDLHRFSPTL